MYSVLTDVYKCFITRSYYDLNNLLCNVWYILYLMCKYIIFFFLLIKSDFLSNDTMLNKCCDELMRLCFCDYDQMI